MQEPLFFAETLQNFGDKDLFRMAKVSGVESGGTRLKFNGESAPTQKLYKKLVQKAPAEGDAVLCVKFSGTYVILGVIE